MVYFKMPVVFVLLLIMMQQFVVHAQSSVEDWAYELPESAKDIYLKTKSPFPCSMIEQLITTKAYEALYITIRDAGMFRDSTCHAPIIKHYPALMKLEGVKDATAYYLYVMGDSSMIKRLADSFDRDAKKIGDHWTVELFGLLPDWEISGLRLVRHSAYADGASAELLCSALMWRRFLYGEVDFEKHWLIVGKKEGVPEDRLLGRLNKCLR